MSQKTILRVARFCVKELGVKWTDVSAPRRDHAGIVWARQVAQFICHEVTGARITQLAAAFNREHSGVLHSLKTIAGYMDVYPEVKAEIDALKAKAMRLPGVPKQIRLLRKAA